MFKLLSPIKPAAIDEIRVEDGSEAVDLATAFASERERLEIESVKSSKFKEAVVISKAVGQNKKIGKDILGRLAGIPTLSTGYRGLRASRHANTHFKIHDLPLYLGRCPRDLGDNQSIPFEKSVPRVKQNHAAPRILSYS